MSSELSYNSDQPGFDGEDLLLRLMNDRELASLALDGFFEESSDLLDGVTKALDADDVDKAKEHIHTLKGSSANVSAKRLSDFCAQAESKIKESGSLKDLNGWIQLIQNEMSSLKNEVDQFVKG